MTLFKSDRFHFIDSKYFSACINSINYNNCSIDIGL